MRKWFMHIAKFTKSPILGRNFKKSDGFEFEIHGKQGC